VKILWCLAFAIFVIPCQAATLQLEHWYDIRYHLTIFGPITSGDSDNLRKAVLSQLRSGHLIDQFNIFSSGGSVEEAIGMGEQIRRLGAATAAPEVLDGKPQCLMGSLDAQSPRAGEGCDCQSACFIVWAAGLKRYGAYVGVHRPRYPEEYFKSLTSEQASQQYAGVVEKTADYFKKMELPDWATSKMYSVASANMRFLSSTELEQLRTTTAWAGVEEYMFAKCHSAPSGSIFTSEERRAYMACVSPVINEALSRSANDYLSAFGKSSESFIQAPPPPPSPPQVATLETPLVPPPFRMAPSPPPAATPEGCEGAVGDEVVIGVKWGDSDGGLMVRAAPSVAAGKRGTIPADAVGVRRDECQGNWCRVTYRCLTGWASAQFLSSRQANLSNVLGVRPDDPDGLNVRAGPGMTYSVKGSIPYDATNLVRHTCETNTGTEWCLVSYRETSGWVSRHFLSR
jgi:uncharacterized protein YraI